MAKPANSSGGRRSGPPVNVTTNVYSAPPNGVAAAESTGGIRFSASQIILWGALFFVAVGGLGLYAKVADDVDKVAVQQAEERAERRAQADALQRQVDLLLKRTEPSAPRR